jgi:large subunit ribosomal protein L16
MLMPKRTKYRKSHRISYDGHARGNTELQLGDYGLMSLDGAWVSAKEIEAARIAMTRFMKRGGNVYINIFPHMPRTKKPLETRQGKGKGDVDEWVAVVKKGKIMFEIGDIDEATAREALRLASHKLPVRTKFVKKEKDGDSLGN